MDRRLGGRGALRAGEGLGGGGLHHGYVGMLVVGCSRSATVRECEGPKVQSLSTDRCRVRLPGWQEHEHRQVREPELEHRKVRRGMRRPYGTELKHRSGASDDCRNDRSPRSHQASLCDEPPVRSMSTAGADSGRPPPVWTGCDGPRGRSRSTVRCERGAGAAASDTYVTINEVKKVPIRIRAS